VPRPGHQTIPLIGWTPKSRAISCGFASATYVQQQKIDDMHGCADDINIAGQQINTSFPANSITLIELPSR